jgi:hypothetical protein
VVRVRQFLMENGYQVLVAGDEVAGAMGAHVALRKPASDDPAVLAAWQESLREAL